jgi:3-oxoacid CoA-transferase subunit B
MRIGLTEDMIAMRIAQEFQDGLYVNLGIGLPTRASLFVKEGMEVMLQAENGILGWGRVIEKEDENYKMDFELINPSLNPVTIVPGASFFDCVLAFTMMRGGHVGLTVLGAYQVSEKGDLANWMRPGQKFGGVGGAMDLVAGKRGRVIAAMIHTTTRGEPKIVKECTYPLTGRGVVDTIITSLAVIEVTPNGLLLKEVAPGISPQIVQAATEPELILSDDLKEMKFLF